MQLYSGAYYCSRKRISAGNKRGEGNRRKRTYRDVAETRRRSRDGGKSWWITRGSAGNEPEARGKS